MPTNYKYDPGHHRGKHRWKRDHAGFTLKRGVFVGKCSAKITRRVAESLLNDGVAIASGGGNLPIAIYNTYEGAIYVARVTNPNPAQPSYHGYPWRSDGERGIPINVVEKLREKAKEQGYEKEFNKWLKKYGPPR